jgi:hypothetical protein
MENRLRDLQQQIKSKDEVVKLIASSDTFKTELSTLSKRFLRKEVSGCNTCYYDAYVKLLLIKEIMPDCDFQLRSGALLKDLIFKKQKMVSKHNITNELALYYLKTQPIYRKFFTVMPKNVDTLVANFDIVKMKVIEPKEEIKINESSKPQKRKKT